MRAAAKSRKSKQQEGFPIIHFYEEFIKNRAERHPKTESVDSTSPTVQMSVYKKRRSGYVGKSPDTSTTQGTTPTETEPTGSRVRRSVDDIQPKDLPYWGNNKRTTSANPPVKRRYNSRVEGTKPWNIDRGDATVKRLSIYERSQEKIKQREKKLEDLRKELYQECTFHPKKSAKPIHSRVSSANREGRNVAERRDARKGRLSTVDTLGSTLVATSTISSSAREYWQDLQRQQLSSCESRDGTFTSRMSSTVKSYRFEELYQDGVRRARQRPATEKEESERRDRRLEEEQKHECTFKPKLYWGNKVSTQRRKSVASSSQHRSMSCRHKETWEAAAESHRKSYPISETKNSAAYKEPTESVTSQLSWLRRHRGAMYSKTTRKIESPKHPVPLEITVQTIKSKRWSVFSRYPMEESVSPLQVAGELKDDEEKVPLAPRIIYCGTTVGEESHAAKTEMTEYGSI